MRQPPRRSHRAAIFVCVYDDRGAKILARAAIVRRTALGLEETRMNWPPIPNGYQTLAVFTDE